MNLDWLFIFVLPVARDWEPRVRYVAISSFVLTSASVTPASVIPPCTVSLICMGTLAGTDGFARNAPSALEKMDEFGSSKSNTSSLNICHHSIPRHWTNKLKYQIEGKKMNNLTGRIFYLNKCYSNQKFCGIFHHLNSFEYTVHYFRYNSTITSFPWIVSSHSVRFSGTRLQK